MRTMHLTIGAAVAALGFSNLVQAQIPPAKPGQGASHRRARAGAE